MIKVEHLSKQYGQKLALDDLSFSIEKGEVVGLVGPNGAGKSTTMNILTGFISATKGEVFIDGLNLFEEPQKVKQSIGYSPEKPPLYGDMTVNEYLSFCYNLKKLHLNKKDHITEICERINIENVRTRVIRKLSRGYQQRVGIAQALLGYPKVLILDEPTVGLDPGQMIEVRKLIGELGGEHTIILSSHILSEVESVCGRVILLNKGKMVRFGTPTELSHKGGEGEGITIRVDGPGTKVSIVLGKVKNISRVRPLGEKEKGTHDFLVVPNGEKDIRREISKALSSSGIVLLEMHASTDSLEDVFLEATGSLKDTDSVTSQKADYLNKPPVKYKKEKGGQKKK